MTNSPTSGHYEVRMLDIYGLRDKYLEKAQEYVVSRRLSPKLLYWEEAAYVADWVIVEAIGNVLGKHVVNHLPLDSAKTLYQIVRSELENDVFYALQSTGLQTRKEQLVHLKVLVLSNLLIVAALRN